MGRWSLCATRMHSGDFANSNLPFLSDRGVAGVWALRSAVAILLLEDLVIRYTAERNFPVVLVLPASLIASVDSSRNRR
jgi:hypothetical protein